MYLYFLHNNNDALDAFKIFKSEVEKRHGKQIKIVRLDRDGEYHGEHMGIGQAPNPFVKFLKKQDLAQYIMPGSPYHNTMVERRN